MLGESALRASDHRPRILLVVGTRPEVIKTAPVALELRAQRGEFDTVVCSTGQHRDMLDQALAAFDLECDVDLQLMRPRQTLTGLTTRTLEALDEVMTRVQPDLVVVQGDTTSAMTGALAGYYNRIPVGHLEAGLRTSDLFQPFPEEGNLCPDTLRRLSASARKYTRSTDLRYRQHRHRRSATFASQQPARYRIEAFLQTATCVANDAPT
jgi:UDP-N-acetylglucosamine 2-epimerase